MPTREDHQRIGLMFSYVSAEEGGVPVGDVCRLVASPSRRYRWKNYGSMLPSEARKLKQLRDDNTRLKCLVADPSLDKVMLQDIVPNKVLKPVRQREVVHYLEAIAPLLAELPASALSA